MILGVGALAIVGLAIAMLGATEPEGREPTPNAKASAKGSTPDKTNNRKRTSPRTGPSDKVKEGLVQTAKALRPPNFDDMGDEHGPDSVKSVVDEFEGWLGDSDNHRAAPTLNRVDCSAAPCVISIDFNTRDMSFQQRAREYLANASELGEPELIMLNTDPGTQRLWMYWLPGDPGTAAHRAYSEAARQRVVAEWEHLPTNDPSMNL